MPHLFANPEFWVLVAFIVLIAALWKPAKRFLIGVTRRPGHAYS